MKKAVLKFASVLLVLEGGNAFLLPPASAATDFQSLPAAAQSENRELAQIKDAQRVVSYFNKLNPPLVRADRGGAGQVKAGPALRLPLSEALSRFVPADYKVTTRPGIDLQTVITYDQSLPWMEALGKGLAAVSLQMDANLYRKAMQIKHFEATLAEVIEKHIPSNYKVFTDAEVNVDSMLNYDERDHWVDALEKSGAESGLDITANITRKLIVIKPLINTNKDEIKKP